MCSDYGDSIIAAGPGILTAPRIGWICPRADTRKTVVARAGECD